MTREEALEVMNILRFGPFEEVINTREIVNEALAVAIEALRTEKICPVFSDDEVKQPCINCLKCELERPHGKWIIVDDCEKFIARCSICGRILDSRMVKNYPFCRCGADMREKKDDLAEIIEATRSMKDRSEANESYT